MRSFFLTVTIFVLLLLSPLAWAVKVSSIYQAEVPVASQSSQEKNQAAVEGLSRVLIKVSGNSQVFESYPSLKTALSQASSLVQQFSYKRHPTAQKESTYLLTMHFDPESINHLLRDAGSPIWGKNRPLIITWLVFEGTNHPADVVDSSPSDVQKALKYSSEQRGLPIILPTMDMTDLNQVTVNAITDKAIATLENAAKRYDTKAMLIGNITQSNTGFDSQWRLVMGTEQWDWNVAGTTVQEVCAGVINNVADTLASKYSAVLSEAAQAEVVLKIGNVKQQADLMSLMKYLQHLATVADVQLASVIGSDVVLNVGLRGSQQAFVRALALGKNLEPIKTNDAQDTLSYKWLP